MNRPMLFSIFFVAAASHAECDFKTADYIEEMANPASITSIDVEIPKSAKHAKNLFKIISSRSANIPNELKIKFDGNLIVTYDFGVCRYPAKIRQSGDGKDHVKLVNGSAIQSLDVKLKAGNVVSAVRFKLLIPETRHGRNEVFGAFILRELGFIAPETFEVDVSVNGVHSTMLFQEKAEKELLERNRRREGPIFEGDESLLWSYGNFSNFHLEPLALSRLVNASWFEKGATSQQIVMQSLNRLQKAYLDYGHSVLIGKNQLYLQVNSEDDFLFNDYHRLLLAMNGSHGLRPHNRKFYFNSIQNRFEPIYYDGDLKISRFEQSSSKGLEFFANAPESRNLEERLKTLLSSKKVQEDFLKRLKLDASNDDFFTTSVNHLLDNLEILRRDRPSDKRVNWDAVANTADYSWYSKFQSDNHLSQAIIERVDLQGENARLHLADASKLDVLTADLSAILSKNEFEGERAVVFPEDSLFKESESYRDFQLGGNTIRVSEGIEFTYDEKNSKLILVQTRASDWALLLGGDYSNWQIKFRGLPSDDSLSEIGNQRFNVFGLTGCLTLYKSIINNTSLEVTDGSCEDSLNLLGVEGGASSVRISDAFADALDADFSMLTISELKIQNAGNDCFDVSGGVYGTQIAEFKNCADKAISVGEMSVFTGESVRIDGADIGISAKDLSRVNIDVLDATDTVYCGEAKRKKQEFGGGVLKIRHTTCSQPFVSDNESVVAVGRL